MDVEKDEDEMPVPDYAEGTRILLIEPSMASRRHVIPLLEAATYRVKSTRFANAALSMIRARASEYDLVVASTQMQGMDCVTFLKTLKTFSKIPVVLISNEVNNQLAIKTLKLGACQFFERPILRYDARCLWQHVFSKGKKKAANDAKNEEDELPESDNSDQLVMDYKGKGTQREFPEKGVLTADGSTGSKQNEQEMQKRKRSDDDGEEETGQPGIDKPESSAAAAARRKNMKSDNNPGKWNAELLTKDKGKAIPAMRQQDVGTTDRDMMLPQHSKATGHPNSETAPSRKLNLGNKSRSAPKFESVSGAEKEQHGTGSSSFQQEAQLHGTPKLNLGKNISLLNNNNHVAVNEIINKQSKFKGRIDHIRHEYWTNTQPGNGTFIANYGYHGSSSSDLGYYSPSSARPPHQSQSSENHVQPMLQTYYRVQTETTRCFHLPYSDSNYNSMSPSDGLANQPINDLGRENLEDYSSEQNLNNADASNAQHPTEDDLIFEEILAELRDDFLTNNDLRSLGFSDITGL